MSSNDKVAGAARAVGTSVAVAPVTPSNTVRQPEMIALWVGSAGDVAVTMWDGSTATIKNVPAGTKLDICPMLVNSAGTTATNLVALL